ncbi:flagellar hook-length control protein FliK [Mixta tenebrionis]|uniref:Flagellar hook-length control protein-like C-terminal domain-containing protein n=1 Tax=Mixta tenebrionis TaxID=2562439 RepID=A0A506V4R4_9GAMM|nr:MULTISPECIES: flagellar hook-length control protein FliK [Mixta]QHM77473.1 Flagellar hook-length control protein [Mixta theicola]TPW40645.1 hypothetical protein FKM52_17130 [Mixta tenebrionis]
MMVNVVAALTGASFDNAGNAPAETGENGDFATTLGMQLALLPLAAGGELPVDAALPDGELPIDPDAAADKKPDEVGDEQWLSIPSAPVLAPAALIETALAPALPQAAAAAVVPETADAPAEPHKNAVTDLLRMIASPQSAVAAEPSVTPQTPAAAQSAAQTQAASAFAVPDQPEQEQLPVEAREPVSVDNAPAAEHRPVSLPFTTSTTTLTQPASSSSAPMTPATAYATLEEKVGSPAWQQALGHQLSSFTRNGVHHAELRLHPEELGPLQINLRLSHDQAQLHFMTEHHQVRAALEAAMPHLRASLAESGIQLGQGSVGSEAPAWGSSESGSGHSSQSQQERESAIAAEVEEETSPRLIHGQASGISIFA